MLKGASSATTMAKQVLLGKVQDSVDLEATTIQLAASVRITRTRAVFSIIRITTPAQVLVPTTLQVLGATTTPPVGSSVKTSLLAARSVQLPIQLSLAQLMEHSAPPRLRAIHLVRPIRTRTMLSGRPIQVVSLDRTTILHRTSQPSGLSVAAIRPQQRMLLPIIQGACLDRIRLPARQHSGRTPLQTTPPEPSLGTLARLILPVVSSAKISSRIKASQPTPSSVAV